MEIREKKRATQFQLCVSHISPLGASPLLSPVSPLRIDYEHASEGIAHFLASRPGIARVRCCWGVANFPPLRWTTRAREKSARAGETAEMATIVTGNAPPLAPSPPRSPPLRAALADSPLLFQTAL